MACWPRDLQDIDEKWERFHGVFSTHLAPLMASEGNTNKYHRQWHFTTFVRRLGHPKHYNSQFFEAAHAFIKRDYR